jgi:RNA-binding protein
MKRKLSDLKHEASQLSPLISVGKNGITEPLIEELIYQLKQHKLVKVKIHKTALNNEDKQTFAEELSIRTGSELIEMRGSNVVLYRK